MKPGRTAARLAPILALCVALLVPKAGWTQAEPASWTAAPTPSVNTPRLYVLSFSNAAIDDVAAAVLGSSLGLPFDFDSALQGEMSLQVEERMTPDQLMGRFTSALAAAGGTVVHQDGRLRLMPTAKARRLTQMEKRAQGVLNRFTYEQTLASSPAPLSAGAAKAGPPSPPEPSPSLGWVALAALSGGVIALSVAGLLSRFTFGQVPRAGGKRGAVMDRLLASDPIDPALLADARRLSAEHRQPLEQTLNQMGGVSDDALARAYAHVTGCAIWRPAERPALIGQFALGPTPDYLRVRGLVPVAVDAKRLVMAALDPLDDEAIAAVAATAARPVTILVGTATDVRDALDAH